MRATSPRALRLGPRKSGPNRPSGENARSGTGRTRASTPNLAKPFRRHRGPRGRCPPWKDRRGPPDRRSAPGRAGPSRTELSAARLASGSPPCSLRCSPTSAAIRSCCAASSDLCSFIRSPSDRDLSTIQALNAPSRAPLSMKPFWKASNPKSKLCATARCGSSTGLTRDGSDTGAISTKTSPMAATRSGKRSEFLLAGAVAALLTQLDL